jgi:hypothetical protein
MVIKKKGWIYFWGSLWIFAGMMLLRKGFYFLTLSSALSSQWMVVFASLACVIGCLKGKFVLEKRAKKIIAKILLYAEDKVPIGVAMDRQTLMIMAVMMGLGFSLNVIKAPHMWRGFIDVAIGSALMMGGMSFFRIKQKGSLPIK